MISDAMELIRGALQRYILEVETSLDSADVVILENIAMADELGGTNIQLKGHLVMSLVNLQEEATLRNTPNYRLENGRAIYQNPAVNLNLFILFSALYDDYETALKRLSRVVEFLQWKKEFSVTTTPGKGSISQDVRVLLDLYSLTFEQLNHLWGALGGKQVPFLLYRARVVSLEAQKRQAEGEVITEINQN
ncbi:MAG: DUF4255 domain-containing protein [Xenococcus sp. (in: cyanobacteria)]